MKLFQEKLLERAFDNETSVYKLNETYDDYKSVKGLVTNPTITNKGNLHFHSRELFKRGDMLQVGNEYYLIDSDVNRLRGAKYKGIGYYCNWSYTIEITERVQVGTDAMGRPIYDDIVVGERIERGILNFKEFSLPSGQLLVPTLTYHLTVKDSEHTRELLTINKEIKIEGEYFKVFNIAYDKDGVLSIIFRGA